MMRFPQWRKMTWAIVVWSVVMAIWIVGGLIGADNSEECARETGRVLSQDTCVAARDAGTGLAVIVLWFIWFFGFLILSLIWFMTRPKGRTCPVCGEDVKRGHVRCPSWGYDFAAAAQQAPGPLTN